MSVDNVWLVARYVPTAQHRAIRWHDVTVFATEQAANEWADTHPTRPGERRTVFTRPVAGAVQALGELEGQLSLDEAAA